MNTFKLTEEQLHNIEQVWDYIKDTARAIYISGSVCLNFINNPHDIDVILMFDTLEKRREYYTMLKENDTLKQLIKNASESLNLSYISNILNDTLERLYSKPWMYVIHYMKPIYGEDLHIDFNLEEKRETLIQVLKDYLTKLKPNTKALYYVLTSIYIIENNSFEFTDEQKEAINICHDHQDEEKTQEYYTYCVDWLSNN